VFVKIRLLSSEMLLCDCCGGMVEGDCWLEVIMEMVVVVRFCGGCYEGKVS